MARDFRRGPGARGPLYWWCLELIFLRNLVCRLQDRDVRNSGWVGGGFVPRQGTVASSLHGLTGAGWKPRYCAGILGLLG